MLCKKCQEVKEREYFETSASKICKTCIINAHIETYARTKLNAKNNKIIKLNNLIENIIDACESRDAKRLKKFIEISKKEISQKYLGMEADK